jgi:hypothetical protein
MKSSRRLVYAIGFAAAGLLSAAAVADADTVAITNSSTFDAITTGRTTTGFNSIGSGGLGTGPLTTGDFYGGLGASFSINSITFSATNSGINVNSASFYNQFPPTIDITNQYLVNTYPPSGDMTLTITLPTAVTAFALDFSALFADTTATFVLSNGYTTTVPANDFDSSTSTLGTQFLGFVSTTPFNTISLTVPEAASWVVEDVTSGTATAVPEPSTWAMMLISFAGLGFAGYRSGRRRWAAIAA